MFIVACIYDFIKEVLPQWPHSQVDYQHATFYKMQTFLGASFVFLKVIKLVLRGYKYKVTKLECHCLVIVFRGRRYSRKRYVVIAVKCYSRIDTAATCIFNAIAVLPKLFP